MANQVSTERNNFITKTDTETDWSSQADQQVWFDRYKSQGSDGLRLQQFQEFLQDTLYCYFSKFPQQTSETIDDKITNNSRDGLLETETTATICRFTHQQEMQLFKVFDSKNDHLIDREEFHLMCSKWLAKTYRPSCALVVVDVQNDFIDGSLALINGPAKQDGAEVVPVINDLIDSCNFHTIVYTLDWHPSNHIGFHANLHMRKYKLKNELEIPVKSPINKSSKDPISRPGDVNIGPTTGQAENTNENNNPSSCHNDRAMRYKFQKLSTRADVFDTVLFDNGQVEQKLWPTHCVQNSWGAELHPKLRIVDDAVRIYKGTLPHVDAYSAFWDNMRLNETGLRQELASRDVRDVFFCGLAFDYCVASSALDSIKAGFVTFVIEDACRGIDGHEIELKRDELISNGALIVNSSSVKGYLKRSMTRGNNNNNNNNSDHCQNDGHKINHMKEAPNVGINLDRNMIKNICFKRALI